MTFWTGFYAMVSRGEENEFPTTIIRSAAAAQRKRSAPFQVKGYAMACTCVCLRKIEKKKPYPT
jgi:hypothetical protein